MTFIVENNLLAVIFNCLYIFTGVGTIEKILRGKGVIIVLVLLFAVAMAPWFMKYQAPGCESQSERKPVLPSIPTAFTGRRNEIQRLIDYVVLEHISIVAVTGGPGYGKSSVAIVSSHELVRQGIQVYYVSLLEENSIEAFVMAFMHTTNRRSNNKQTPDKGDFLSWVSSLDSKTVVVLDNADLLTLRRTDLRNNFLKLLKDAAARSSNIHFVVATRYRIKFANDFADIHLSALDSADAVTLLGCVVHPSKQTCDKSGGSVDDEHLKGIANRTGGIPLALKVVGELVKSGVVSTAEVLDELAADPLDALSRESFPPDEQLKRCFSLSYKYLSKIMRECLIYASRFPGTFDRYARDTVITTMTGDTHCLDQLVDRSLVEYSSVEKRYAMHTLLRMFVANTVVEQPPKRMYFRLFCSHYIRLLSTCIAKARTDGHVDHLYTTITADYHNFVHVLHIYRNESITDQPFVIHKEMLLFANQAFDVMKSSFPWEVLLDWWTALLKNICIRVSASEFQLLAPQFIQLSTKCGNLLLYHKQYQLAADILQFADQCVFLDVAVAFPFITCQHTQADSYTGLLVALMKVYEEDGLVHKALEVRERLHNCVDRAPDKKPEDLIPDDFCTAGIAYMREKHANSKDFNSAVRFFDGYFKCFHILDKEASNWIKMLEDAYSFINPFLHSPLRAVLGIAKRCNMVRSHRKEAEWLIAALKVAELSSLQHKDLILFELHFRLTHLYWSIFNNAEKAVESGKAAYSLAIKHTHIHINIWMALIRLADILHQIDGRQSEAGFYFEEALKYLPFVTGDQETIYAFQMFAELHLASIRFNACAGQQIRCFHHYGQWAKLEASLAWDQACKIIHASFRERLSARFSDIQSLAVVDSSMDGFLGQSNMARKFLHAFIHKAQYSTVYYTMMTFIIVVFGGVLLFIIACTCCTCTVCACLSYLTLIFTRIAYIISLSHYCFHYFIYHAMTRKQVWAPRQLPQIHPAIDLIYGLIIFLFNVGGALLLLLVVAIVILVSITRSFAFYLAAEEIALVAPLWFYNMSMELSDETIYDSLLL